MQPTISSSDPMAPSPYRASIATGLGVVASAIVALIGVFHPGFHLPPAAEATVTQTVIPVATVAIAGLAGWYQHGHHKLELAKIASAANTVGGEVIHYAPMAGRTVAAVTHTDLMANAGLTPADTSSTGGGGSGTGAHVAAPGSGDTGGTAVGAGGGSSGA